MLLVSLKSVADLRLDLLICWLLVDEDEGEVVHEVTEVDDDDELDDIYIVNDYL